MTYNLEDCYCPGGHRMVTVPASLMFGAYCYCGHCDKIYVPSLEERDEAWFSERFHSDRYVGLKDLAKVRAAMDRVTKSDLINLGYL